MDMMRLQVILSAVDKITAPFKGAIGATQKLRDAISATKDQLKGLEQTQRGIAKLTELQNRAKTTAASIGDMQGKLEKWRKEQELASEASKVHRAEIKTLTKTMGGLETVMKYNKSPEIIAQYAMASERLGQLNRQLEWSSSKQKAAAKSIREGNNALLNMNNSAQSTTEHIQRLSAELTGAGVDISQLANEEGRLKTKLDATNAALESQRQKMAQVAEHQRRMSIAQAAYAKTRELQGRLAGTGVGLMATGAATGAMAIKPVLEFAQAEDAATGLKVSMMGAGGVVRTEFGAISDLATKLGNQLPGTTADFQNMMSTLIQQGMSAKSILGGLGQATAYLGVQMKMPYDQAAQFAAKLQDATGTAEKDMMGLMDTIQRSYYLGVDSGNMLAAFTKLSPALSVLRKNGLEASQALAPLVVMADQSGMAGEASGNAYRKIFQMSMNPDKVSDANDRMAKAGIKLHFSDGKGEFAGLDNLFTQLAKLKKLNTETRLQALKDIYGDDAETLQALNLMIDKGLDGYKATQQKMADQANLQSRVNAQLGTLKNLWDAASGTFTNALVAFGEAVAPEVKALVKWIGDLSERLGAWSKAHPVLSNRLMKTAVAIAVVTAGAGALALSVAAVLGPFAMLRFSAATLGLKLPLLGSVLKGIPGVLGLVTQGVIRLGIAMLTNPMGLAIMGIVAVVAFAAAMIYKHWAPIKAFMLGVFEGISSAIGPLKEILAPLEPLFGAIVKGLKMAFSWFTDLLEPVKYTSAELQNAGNMGKAFGQILVDSINMALRPLNVLIDSIKWVLDNISKIPMGDGAANHAMAISNGTALASGYSTGNWGGSSDAGPYRQYKPVSVAPRNNTMDTTIHAPITINPTAGMDEKAVGKAVRKELQAVQSQQAARARARIGDRD